MFKFVDVMRFIFLHGKYFTQIKYIFYYWEFLLRVPLFVVRILLASNQSIKPDITLCQCNESLNMLCSVLELKAQSIGHIFLVEQ